MKKEFNEKSPQPKTTTYAVLLSSGTVFSEGKAREVKSRDPKKLKVPPHAHGFYFFDQTSIVINGETLTGKVKNEGRLYLVGDSLLTLDDLKQKHPQGGSVLDQIERKHIRYVVRNSGEGAEYQSVKHDSIVVNSQGEVIYPTAEHKKAQARIDKLVGKELAAAAEAGLLQTIEWIGKYLAAAKDAPDLRADAVDDVLLFTPAAEDWRKPVKPSDDAGASAKAKYIVASLVSSIVSREVPKDYLFKQLSADYAQFFGEAPAAKKKPAARKPATP